MLVREIESVHSCSQTDFLRTAIQSLESWDWTDLRDSAKSDLNSANPAMDTHLKEDDVKA